MLPQVAWKPIDHLLKGAIDHLLTTRGAIYSSQNGCYVDGAQRVPLAQITLDCPYSACLQDQRSVPLSGE